LGNEKLLDLIYDAAAESELCSQVLTEIADRSAGGILFGQSVTASKVYFDFNGRLSHVCNRAHQDRHMKSAWSESMETGRLASSFFPMISSTSQPSARHCSTTRSCGLGT
jgi:hypothetical protein